ncbi:MAG: homoaconitate hydratase, partial [Phycisphaerales bacterium]|nr:homoaconitate hydratase [Phycisphaerales bacterium]
DTVGLWDPWSVELVLRELRDEVGNAIELGFHAHNDLGLATANALAALRAGADCVDVTVSGLGERAGNAALEEVVMASSLASGIDLGIITQRLAPLCDLVANASGRAIPAGKPIVGANMNRHESGIHVHGMLQDPQTYQPFDPAQVGRGPWELVLGKHSGSAALRHSLSQQGLDLNPQETPHILAKLRKLAEQRGGPITVQDVKLMCG